MCRAILCGESSVVTAALAAAAKILFRSSHILQKKSNGSALSARNERMLIVKDFSAIVEPKTKLMVEVLKSLKVEGKTLIIADVKAAENKYLELSARNIPSVKMILPSNLNVKDILEADYVIVTESAVNEITERLQ